jgi:AcrR family transcriptional regulator
MARRAQAPAAGSAGASSGGLAPEGLPAWQLARRQRIVGAAVTALGRQEYELIQIRDVAAEAGVALGTLYRYFSSKEHLYAAVLQEWAAFGRATSARASRLAPEARARRRVHSVIRALQKQPQFYKVHVLLQASADSNARELLAQVERVALDSLASEFDMLGPAEAEDVAVMLWSIIHAMVTQVIYRGGKMPEVHRIVDRFLDLVLPAAHSAAPVTAG